MMFWEKKFNYNIETSNDLFMQVREKIIEINIDKVAKKDLIKIFSEVNRTIMLLNGAIVSKLDELKTQQNTVNKFFI